jgi:hypothetical protein
MARRDRRKKAPDSIADRVRKYIETRPSIRDCVGYGVINYSALSRMIREELGEGSEDAILAACRRHARSRRGASREKEIVKLLRESRLEMRSDIVAITARRDQDILSSLGEVTDEMIRKRAVMQIIQGASGITIITDDQLYPRLVTIIGRENILKVRNGLVEISVRSPERIGDISGIIAYLSSAVAEEGINAVEMASCHTDTIFLFEEEDAFRAYEILSAHVRAR